jgi:hypothetical protein
MASLEPTSIDFEQARRRGGERLDAAAVFSQGSAFGADLATLLEWIAAAAHPTCASSIHTSFPHVP